MNNNPTPEHREQARSFAEVRNLASRLQCTCVGERANHHAQCPVKIGTEIVAAIESLMAVEQRCGTQYVDASESEQAYQNRMRVFSLVAEPQDRFPSRWTNPPREQAREIVERWIVSTHSSLLNLTGLNMPALVDRIAAALSSRDTEVRELLSGFIHAGVEFDDERMSYVVMQVDRRDLEKARELYAKLQPGEKKLTGR